MRVFFAFLLSASIALVGCKKDESPKQVRQLREEYTALIDRGRMPSAPEFDELAKKLEQIPSDASAYPQAQEMLTSIRRAQAKMPPRPLAKEGGDHTVLEQQRSRCAELAKQLGRATPEERPEVEKTLQTCREQLEKLSIQENQKDHPPH